MNRSRVLTVLVVTMTLLSGCVSLWPDETQTRRGASSSLVDFLYPDGAIPPEHMSKARLQLPLRVGIGFLPDDVYGSALTEQDRNVLLTQVEQAFASRDYVQNIVLIPQTYLRTRKGALALEQVGRLYNLDVIGLVSYDQTTASEARKSSLLYWTILGAYVVKGNSNEVSTFLDMAVLDVDTKKLLLRAGGVHESQRNSTLVDRDAKNRQSQLEGFRQATTDLIVNVTEELERFEQSIDESESVEVVRRSGGAGALWFESWLLGVLLWCRFVYRRNQSRTVRA